jgi:hypothetical protein
VEVASAALVIELSCCSIVVVLTWNDDRDVRVSYRLSNRLECPVTSELEGWTQIDFGLEVLTRIDFESDSGWRLWSPYWERVTERVSVNWIFSPLEGLRLLGTRKVLERPRWILRSAQRLI